MNELAHTIGNLLKERGMWLGTVESATGGLISSMITDVPGSSDYYQGGIIAYSNESKMKLLGVKRETLDKYGSVSAQVAEEMAAGGCKALGANICISDTGIAGPTGATVNKPLGLFYFGLSHQGNNLNRRHVFKGRREENKAEAAGTALTWLKEYLSGLVIPKEETLVLKVQPVVTCFLESNGRILMVRRSAKVNTYQGLWGAISGYIDSTTPDRQAAREIREEAGLSIRDIRLVKRGEPLAVVDKRIKTRWEVYPYLFKVINPEKLKFDWEQQETRWIKPAEISSLETVPKLKEALDSVLKELP
ncbi:MAG TPA: nicotinamide-nucleotide amidohydrolase family protein [Dehalococcoidales bacterium]|nr:nicotinamide-nucleotide amidohydrolase family protein [Dehalococcoidales bacterium]